MPFNWEKFVFEATSEGEKEMLHLFEVKHPKEFKAMQTRVPINHEKAVCVFYGWYLGMQDGRFQNEEEAYTLDAAFGIDVCATCPDCPEETREPCDDFPCGKIPQSAYVEPKRVSGGAPP